jgi:hypothetical protein
MADLPSPPLPLLYPVRSKLEAPTSWRRCSRSRIEHLSNYL